MRPFRPASPPSVAGGEEWPSALRRSYAREIEAGRLCRDAGQIEALDAFEDLCRRLRDARRREAGPRGFLRRLGGRKPAPPRGIYLWGGVGRGKTLIMNAFFDALPFSSKRRVHFHAFMHYVHAELRELGHRRDPLRLVAEGLAADARIVCFDEFQVSDITDAMLLGGLLRELFERGVTLVATSNVEPERLYWGGLQRDRFLPAIELLKTHTRVLRLGGGIDYRLRALERADTYYWPLGDAAERGLARCFDALNPVGVREGEVLDIGGRDLPTRRVAEGIAWFEFEALCAAPRSSLDYIGIARRFHTVLLAGVPRLDDECHDAALRFVHLVDALYEHCVNLIVSAAGPPVAIYAGRRLGVRFVRASSRLEEMRSRDYLSRPHLA